MGSDRSEKEFTGTLLHEIQHGVQSATDMVAGGNPGMFISSQKDLDSASANLSKMITKSYDARATARKSGADMTEINRQHDFLTDTQDMLNDVKDKAFQGYKALGGEAEARYTAETYRGNVDKTKIPTSQYDVSHTELLDPRNTMSQVDDDPIIKAILDHLK